MLKQGTFINKKFNRFLLGNFWGWLGYCINVMTDSLISGNQLGEVSLQAVSIVFPLFSIVYFVTYLVAPGASIIYGKRVGEFKEKEAYRTAGTSLVGSIFIGILLAFALWFAKEPFLTYFQCTGELYTEAAAYYNWLLPIAVMNAVQICLYYLAVTDGESALLSLSGVSGILVNVIFSLVLSRSLGIAGLGLATFLSEFVRCISYFLHFLKKSNNVKFRLCLDMKVIGRSIVLGFSRYMTYLFMAVADIVMNKVIISTSGVVFIPAYSVINLVFSFCELFGSLVDSGMGFFTCFLGERNNHDINLTLRKTTSSMLVMSAGIWAFFFFGAQLMPVIYGMETAETIAASVTASRIMSFTSLGYGICYLCTEISCSLEKPGQAGLLSFLFEVLSPVLLSVVLGSIFGFTGIIIGMSLSTYFGFGLYALIQVLRIGKKGFPIYMEDFGAEGVSYDIRVTPEAVTELRDSVSRDLASHGYDIKNVDLLMEEFFTRVMEKNPGKTVLASCTMLFEDGQVRIIIRDDGTIFNFVDENNAVESLNAHVLNSVLEHTAGKNYILTTSFNRNGFIFEK